MHDSNVEASDICGITALKRAALLSRLQIVQVKCGHEIRLLMRRVYTPKSKVFVVPIPSRTFGDIMFIGFLSHKFKYTVEPMSTKPEIKAGWN